MISLGALKAENPSLISSQALQMISGDNKEFSTIGHHPSKSGSFFLTPLWVCDGGAHLTNNASWNTLGVPGALGVN